METVSSWRATYVPGRWLVLAGPTSLVVMQPAPPHMSGLVEDLWQDILSAVDVSDLAQRFAAFRLDLMPHFAAFFWAEDGMHSLIRGALRAVDADSGELVAQGEGFRTWNEVGLRAVRRVRLDMDAAAEEPLLALPLAVGAVLAASVTIDSTEKVPLVLPSASTGHAWTPAPPPEPVLPARSSDPSLVPTPGDENHEDPWGIRDADAVTPVDLFLDENGDGIPDAQQRDPGLDAYQQGSGADAEPGFRPDQSSVGRAPQQSLDLAAPLDLDLPSGPSLDLDEHLANALTEPVLPDPVRAREQAAGPSVGGWAPSAVAQPPQAVVSPVPPPAAPRNMATPGTGALPHPYVSDSPERPEADSTVFSPGIATTHRPTGTGTVVLAALCAFGHPNRPGSSRCRTCGQHVDNSTPRLVQRPVLAQLVTASGARMDVNGTVLIGRAPSAKPEDGDAEVLSVSSPNSDISRTHLKISVHDWDVLATDLSSTNGTTLVRPGQPPVRMMPGTPVAVEPGTILDLGDGGLITVGVPG